MNPCPKIVTRTGPQIVAITATRNKTETRSITTYLHPDLTVKRRVPTPCYGTKVSQTHAALQALELVTCTVPNKAPILIFTATAKLAQIINNEAITNTALRAKEKYQPILMRIHSYVTTCSSTLHAIHIPQNIGPSWWF
jgi:hypothetical protein